MNIFKNKVSGSYPFWLPMGKQLKERLTLEICKRVAEGAGIKSRVFLHKFKHICYSFIHKGIPIESIKELLSNWSVVQMEVYLHNNTDHLLPQVSRLNKQLEK